MKGGWVGKILDVDLTTGEIRWISSLPYAQTTLGGRSLAAQLAWEQIPAGVQPYDPENRIIIATGPFTGTLAPTSGRTIMSSVSPRVYPIPWYTHSTLGGWFGPALKYAGFDAVVIHGRSVKPVYLSIVDGRAELKEAAGGDPGRDLWGMDTRQVQLALRERMHPQTQVLAIGPAGENLVRFATVQHAEENAAAHSGFGAVWGSKKLKAIAVHGTGGVAVADPLGLLCEVKKIGTFKRSPFGGKLSAGSEDARNGRVQRPICSQACPFDCQVSAFGQLEDGRRVPGQCVGAFLLGTEDGMRAGKYSGGGMEVPAGKNFGLKKEAPLHEKCNRLGIDLWLRLVIQPWLIACVQQGINTIRGLPILPEDPEWFDQFVEDMAYRRGLGDLFAEDLARLMDILEGELPRELIALGRELEFNFGFPAHREGRFWDEEPLPFWVISAMMHISESRDPTIGSHQSSLLLADFFLEDAENARRQFRKVSQAAWGIPDGFEPTYTNKAPVAVWSQDQHILIDSLPLCDFAFPQLVRPIDPEETWQTAEDLCGDLELDIRLLAAVTGEALSREEVTRRAVRAFTLERLMLARAGRSRRMEEALSTHFKLPCRADGTSIDEIGFGGLMDEYYGARGWDLALGWPLAETLKSLGLESTIPEVERMRQRLEHERHE